MATELKKQTVNADLAEREVTIMELRYHAGRYREMLVQNSRQAMAIRDGLREVEQNLSLAERESERIRSEERRRMMRVSLDREAERRYKASWTTMEFADEPGAVK